VWRRSEPTLLLFALVRARLGVAAARLAAAAYWLNPASLFDASILGYLDTQDPAGTCARRGGGRLARGGGAGCRRDPDQAQGLFIAPAVALAI
jgi:hypothetical protein